MTAYDHLDSAIGALKLASIDAYMRSKGWTVDNTGRYWKYGNVGDRVERGTFPHTETPDSVACTVSRPDSSGSGGGTLTKHIDWGQRVLGDETSEVAPSTFPQDFDSIRSAIDNAVRPFRRLPDPASLDETLELCRAADYGLWLSAPESGTLGAHIASAKLHMANLRGAFPTAFEALFLNQLETTLGAIRALATARWAALAQEQALWADARTAVEKLVSDATTSMNGCAQHKQADFSPVLTILAWVGAGLTIAVSGGAATPAAVLIAAGNLGLSILTDVNDGELTASSDSKSASFDELLNAFVATASDLRVSVTRAESLVRSSVNGNLDSYFANKLPYQIHKDPNIAVAPGEDIVRDVDESNAVAITFLPAAASLMRSLASTCSAVQPAPLLYRPGDIGCGEHGPGAEFAQSSELLYDLLENLSSETLSACDALLAWMQDLDRHEEAVVAEINALRDQLDTPTVWEPTDTRISLPWKPQGDSHLLEPDWQGR